VEVGATLPRVNRPDAGSTKLLAHQIGDLLGHRSASARAVYLKLATEDLRDVALEVPGEGVEQ
jgi:hypothetical protein